MLDVVIIGGGPAGLQSALTLARGQKQVLVVDGGTPRNARAVEVHNFVTRDGTPPSTFRELARRELAPYGVGFRAATVTGIDGERGDFTVRLDGGEVRARRVLLCTGMVDELPDLPGFRELWGHTIFQCPYCHGHEVRGQRWALLVPPIMRVEFALLLSGWTSDLVLLTDGSELDPAERQRLDGSGIAVETRRIVALERDGDRLLAIGFDHGPSLPRDVLAAKPPQRQTALVQGLGLRQDEAGFVVVDPHHQTSRPGIYAAGDLTTPLQAAIAAAGAGMLAAARLNHELTVAGR